jgi:hypothetical protein
MLTCFYRDLNKAPADTLNQGYVGNKSLKFSSETKSGDFGFKTTASRSFQKNTVAKPPSMQEVVVAVVEPSYEWKEHNLKFDAKLSTATDFTGTLSVKPGFLKDSKFALSANQKTPDWKPDADLRTTLSPSFDYQHEKFAAQVGATVSLNDRPHFANVALNVQPVEKVYLGGAAKFKFCEKETKITGEGKLAYVASDLSASLAVILDKNRVPDKEGTKDDEKLCGKNTLRVGFGFWHKYNSQLTLAGTANMDLSRPGGKGPEIVVGGAWKVDSNLTITDKVKVTLSSVKEPEIRYIWGTTTNLTPNASATIGMDFNVQKLRGSEKAADDHSCGVEFKFKQ